MCDAADFCHDLEKMGIKAMRKKTSGKESPRKIVKTLSIFLLRFLHEDSPIPSFKLGKGAVVVEGKARPTTAIVFSSREVIAEPFLTLLKVSAQNCNKKLGCTFT